MTKHIICTTLIVVLSLISCRDSEKQLQKSLEQAGFNRMEFEKVLVHYQSDPQKLKAAKFLISNMKNKCSIDSTSIMSVQPYYDALINYLKNHGDYGPTMMYYLCDSIKNKTAGSPSPTPLYNYDLQILTSDFLISHIDNSFEAWQNNPQTRNIGFSDFCKFILPYKCDNTFWADVFPYLFGCYKHIADTLKTESFIQIGKSIDKQIKHNFRQDGMFLLQYPFLQPTTKYNYTMARLGSCAEANYTVISTLRSLGIPAAFNLIPYWGNSNAAHSWTEIIGDEPSKYYDNQQTQYDGPQSIIISDMFWFNRHFDFFDGIPENVSIRWCRTVPKVFRENYAIQKDNLANISGFINIPEFFNNPGLEDISDKYIECTDVKIRLDKDSVDKRFAYLCCYVPETYSWTPVAWGKIKSNGTVRFEKMGKNIVYMPAYYRNGQIVPAASPFLLDAKGEIVPLEASQETEPEAVFYSKVPYRSHILYYALDMLNCCFQVADKADMSDTATIHRIGKLPHYGQEIEIENAQPGRYGIYSFPAGRHGFISDIEFYGPDENGNETKLVGKPIGNPGIYGNGLCELFDGSRITYYAQDPSRGINYVGMDFGKPVKITRIVYYPHTDDNGVVPDELYELFYWGSGGWVSLGRQTGRNDKTLVYKDIPKNALMRLHDITTGNENRIFIYKDSKQIFY